MLPFLLRHQGMIKSPVSAWWLEGEIDPADCVAAYQAKGAVSYAASLVNLANPGVHDLAAIGQPLAFDSAYGWYWETGTNPDGFSTQDIYPTQDYTVIGRWSDSGASSHQLFGTINVPNTWNTGIVMGNSGAYRTHSNFGFYYQGGMVASAVYAIAGKAVYQDGSFVGNCAAGSGTCSYPLFICCFNNGGASHGVPTPTTCKWQAFAVYSISLTAGQVLAVSNAMSAL
jgi:hypothetical protein